MKPSTLIPIALAALILPNSSCRADEEERRPSGGPLVRFDPNATPPKDLIAIHGDPTLGLTANHSGLTRRIANTDKWLVGLANSIGREKSVAVMELDHKIGECRMLQILKLSEVFGVSLDGKFLFGHRDKNWECFSASDNRSLWTLEKDVLAMDGIFTPDGKQVIVVHGLGKYSSSMPSAVSWYDATTGKRLRRVMLPGGTDPSMHPDDGGQLAISGGTLFVTRPSESDAKIFVIPEGATEATSLEIDGIESGEAPQVRAGGAKGELLAFFDPEAVRVRRLEGTHLADLGGFATPPPKNADATYPNNVRFSPDGKWLMAGRYGRSFVLPLTSPKFGELIIVPDGAHSGDFTADGKFFVTFDDGGGRALNVASWSSVNAAAKREHPIHCCPITEAGFSLGGDYIVSSDQHKLMLWSKDGRLLAQLVSGREDKGFGVNMQSALILDKTRKIYAADGWNFLEWGLDDVAQRLGRKPLNVPRIIGKVMFNDRNRDDGAAELMNISVDASGENLITATRSEVRFRSMKSPDDSKVLPIPEQNIMMKPRAFEIADSPLRVFLESSSLIYELDPAGAKEPTLLNKSSGGFDIGTGTVFGVQQSGGDPNYVFATPLGSDRPRGTGLDDTVKFEKDWILHGGGDGIAVDGKGPFLFVRGSSRTGSGSLLAVIDWQKKQTVWSQEVEWEPRSAALSADGKRLIVGSSNKAIYIFDFEKMTKGQ
jgi:hypothetical protein